MRGAQQEGHEVRRDMRESAVVLCRRLVPECQFVGHSRLRSIAGLTILGSTSRRVNERRRRTMRSGRTPKVRSISTVRSVRFEPLAHVNSRLAGEKVKPLTRRDRSAVLVAAHSVPFPGICCFAPTFVPRCRNWRFALQSSRAVAKAKAMPPAAYGDQLRQAIHSAWAPVRHRERTCSSAPKICSSLHGREKAPTIKGRGKLSRAGSEAIRPFPLCTEERL